MTANRPTARAMLIAFASFAAAAVLVGLLVPTVRQRFPAGIDALAHATKELKYRTVDGRIAGGFPYKPAKDVTRGSGDEPDDRAWLRIKVIAAKIQEEVAGKQSAEAKHRLGVTFLVLGNEGRAVAALRDAVLYDANETELSKAIDQASDPVLLNDLSVAYAARGKSEERPQDLLIASEAAQRAWELAKTPEAAWNRAMAIEALGLRDQALDAWRHYLKLDSSSGWSMEAQANIERIDTPTDSDLWETGRDAIERAAVAGDDREVERLVARFPQHARMWGERTLLPDWARLSGKDDAAAERQLRIVEAVGAVIRDDAMLADTVSDIRAALRRRDGSLEALRAGLEQYGKARVDYTEERNATASVGFKACAASLERAGARFALMARVFTAACAYYGNDFKTAEEMTSALAERPDVVNRYHSVLAQVLWIRGLSRLQSGLPQSASFDFRTALGIFESMQETDNLIAMHELLSECLLYIGQDDEAFRQRAQALALLSKSGRASHRRQQMMISTARAALRSNSHRTALLCLNDNLAGKPGDARSIDLRVNTLLWRSHIMGMRGHTAAAAADLDEANALATRIADTDLRDYAVNAIEFVAHRLRVAATAEARRQVVDGAVQFAEKAGNGYRVAQLRLMQGREYEAAGDSRRAEQSLLEAVGQVERQRGFLSDEELRSAYLGHEQDVYDELVQFYWKRGDVHRAFAIAESARARTLLDRMTGRTDSASADMSAVMTALPAGVVVVQHAVIGDRLLTWAITRHDVRTGALSIPLAELATDCDRLIAAIASNDSVSIGILSRRLYDVFVRPSGVRAGDAIIFVPDPRLPNVPYAALTNSQDSRYLIINNEVAVSPSATVLVRSLVNTHARPTSTDAERALLVAPLLAADAYGLPPLPAAQREIGRIARLYPGASTQSGTKATRAAFIDAARIAGIIHFAGHTLIGNTALQSRLLFAGADDRQASLYAEDIQNLRLSKSPVVILAACESISDTGSGRQGISSLSRAFLVAGAASVVGSFWRVDDLATANLLAKFHEGLSAGESPATALRAAQLAFLNSNDPTATQVRSWAGFAVLGAATLKGERKNG